VHSVKYIIEMYIESCVWLLIKVTRFGSLASQRTEKNLYRNKSIEVIKVI